MTHPWGAVRGGVGIFPFPGWEKSQKGGPGGGKEGGKGGKGGKGERGLLWLLVGM